MRKFTAKELEAMPTLNSGHFDDLKVDGNNTRIWLSRCGIVDGAKFDNLVVVESFKNGYWIVTEEYQG